MSKENIAHQDPSATLDTVAKFFRVLAKEGITLEELKPILQNIGKRKNLTNYISLFNVCKYSYTTEQHIEAAKKAVTGQKNN